MGLFYDKNNLLKPWVENDTISMLLKRFNKSEADTDVVAGPSKRRKKDHRRKNQKRKEKTF